MSPFKKINEISNNGKVRNAWFGLALAILVCLIIIPSIFVITKIFTEWDLVNAVLGDAAVMAQITSAVWNSFSIAFIVTIIDIVVGIPMAWILVRKQFWVCPSSCSGELLKAYRSRDSDSYFPRI